MKTCTAPKCKRPMHARKWCRMHYQRWRKDIPFDYKKPSLEERFLLYVLKKENGCWEWTGFKNEKGYGQFSYRKIPCRAHRFSFHYFNGPIHKGLQIDHLCRNTSCVNPEHLEAVTARENLLRGDTKMAANLKRTKCPQGHEYSGDNLVLNGTNRLCRTCKIGKQRARRALERKADNYASQD